MSIFGIVKDKMNEARAVRVGIDPGEYKAYVQKKRKDLFIKGETAKRQREEKVIIQREQIKADNELKYIESGGFKGQLKKSLKSYGKQLKKKKHQRAKTSSQGRNRAGPQFTLDNHKPGGPQFGL